MFDPLEFIEFATSALRDDDSEKSCRIAINRAYQGAFLVLREWLKLKGYVFSRRRYVFRHHQEVQDFLFQETNLRSLKDKLHGLRDLRNKADYDIEVIINQDQAQESIDLAQHLCGIAR